MKITKCTISNFRCFEHRTFDVQGNFVIIQGCNGTGKTSLLEALYYGCYLKSFRANNTNELMNIEQDHFFIAIDFVQDAMHPAETIQIGYAGGNKKTVKLDGKPLQTYKDLIAHYRIVSLTADDVALVQGAPELRRDFLNYSLMFHDQNFLSILKTYRRILTQRNALLLAGAVHGDDFAVWTKRLFEQSVIIQQARVHYLQELEQRVNTLIQQYLVSSPELFITFEYKPRLMHLDETYEAFLQHFNVHQAAQEILWRRTLFGAHLDDFMIVFQDKKARAYASRGQQKLITLLIKIAQIQDALAGHGPYPVFLLDDFLTDFDMQRSKECLRMIADLAVQVFLTVPLAMPEQLISAIGKECFLLELK